MFNDYARVASEIFSEMVASGLDASIFLTQENAFPLPGRQSNDCGYEDIETFRKIQVFLSKHIAFEKLPGAGSEFWFLCSDMSGDSGCLDEEENEVCLDAELSNALAHVWTNSALHAVLHKCTTDDNNAKWLRSYFKYKPSLQIVLMRRWIEVASEKTIAQIRISELLHAHPQEVSKKSDAFTSAMELYLGRTDVKTIANALIVGVIEGRVEHGNVSTNELSQESVYGIEYGILRLLQKKSQTGPFDPALLSCPSDAWLAQYATENNADIRPWMFLYTAPAILEFADWSGTRVDVDIVKEWRAKLVSKNPNRAPNVKDFSVAKHRFRRLALAAPALAAMAKLRDGFPHFEDVIEQLVDHLSLAMVGNGTFSLPPLLMAGPPGTGKTFFFQELASLVATNYRVLNMESVSAGFAIVGSESQWANSSPGIVFETLLQEGATANPIILLDELDKAPVTSQAPVTPVLLSLLERHSARRFTDRSIQLPIDASQISWVATANDLSRVDAPLKSRFEVLHVPSPDYNARRALARHIYAALLRDNHWGAWFDKTMSAEMVQMIAGPENAARDLRKNLSKALARAARAHRKYIQPEDLVGHDVSAASRSSLRVVSNQPEERI